MRHLWEDHVIETGDVVTVRGPYIGNGRYGVDAETGKTMKVFRRDGDDLALGSLQADEWEVWIHAGRCTKTECGS